MIQNLITACLLTVSIGNTAIINHESKKTNEIQNTETQIANIQLTTKKQDTETKTINGASWTRNFYYLEGQQTINTHTYEIDSMIMTSQAANTKNQITINTYFRIKKIDYEQPSDEITIKLINAIGKNLNDNYTVFENYNYYNNAHFSLNSPDNAADKFLDIEQIKTENILNFSIGFPSNTIYDEKEYGSQYTNLIAMEETYSGEPMTDGYCRYAVVEELIYDAIGLEINMQYLTVELHYEINKPKTEVIDLPGLLFNILGMPFAFYSQAFNLTLFPGTQYQINVANLIFAVITALIIIFIIRKLIGK